jgi:hypothetical protein
MIIPILFPHITATDITKGSGRTRLIEIAEKHGKKRTLGHIRYAGNKRRKYLFFPLETGAAGGAGEHENAVSMEYPHLTETAVALRYMNDTLRKDFLNPPQVSRDGDIAINPTNSDSFNHR